MQTHICPSSPSQVIRVTRKPTRSSLLRRAEKKRGRPYNANVRKEKAQPMQYERLVRWAQTTWRERYADTRPYATIWASSECSNHIALEQIKIGRRLKGKARYQGFEPIESDIIVPISDYGARGQKMVLTATSGAFLFKFTLIDTEETFEVLYASSYYDDEGREVTAIALVPEERLAVWAAFESACAVAVRPKIRRRRDVYIVGGTDAYFDPSVDWQDVILEEELKNAIFDDIEAFFAEGVTIYQKLKLPPFRKLLLSGVPGTGKTMLCAAIARHALNQRRLVVYVSGSDREGATFEKIQRAFQAVANARFPSLLIVEEIDAYLRGDDKARILNVLDGIESPNNTSGTLLLATTNYPDAIDERIFKRPGRLDRIFVIPPITSEAIALDMLRHYMDEQWHDDHAEIVPKLVDQPGAFVREVALQARMLAAHERQTEINLAMLQKSVDSLLKQMRMDGADFLQKRRPLGLMNRSPFSRPDNP